MQFNLADLYESVADAIGEREALVCGEHRYRYRKLDERANRVAHALAERGIGPGDHVGLYMYNSAEFVETMLACFKLRAVPININYRYVEEELVYLCNNADLKALVYHSEFAARVRNVESRLPALKVLLHVGQPGDDPTGKALPSRSTAFEEALLGASSARDFGPRSSDDLYIIYTGGTTGMPRGVMWRHEDLFFAGLQGGRPGGDPVVRAEDLAASAKQADHAILALPAAPLIHGAAQFAVFIALFSGGKAVLAESRHVDPDLIWQLVERERVTTLLIVGDAMARPLADALERSVAQGRAPDLSSLMVIPSSGAILSATVKEALERLLPGTLVMNNFGSTEAGHQGAAFTSGEGPARRLRFYMDESSSVLGEDGKPLTPGSGAIGRLARKGRVPLGYYKDPEKTAATFLRIDGVRWVIPGDLATIEEDGLITVLGRGAVCINTGGEKVFPEEVEEALKAHPWVLDAVVVGVPDARWGERVAALVQARDGQGPTSAELDAHCRTHVAGYKVPREVHFIDEIVRHPSGKPDYRWARSTAIAAGQTAPETATTINRVKAEG